VTGPSGSTTVGFAVVCTVGAAVALGLWYAGSPAAERSRRVDERRVEDLRRFADRIDLYWTREGVLPPSRAALTEAGSDVPGFEDPVTSDRYEYRTLSTSTFELCARFDMATGASEGREFWRHLAGRRCFEVDVEDVERHRRWVRDPRPLPEEASNLRPRSPQPQLLR